MQLKKTTKDTNLENHIEYMPIMVPYGYKIGKFNVDIVPADYMDNKTCKVSTPGWIIPYNDIVNPKVDNKKEEVVPMKNMNLRLSSKVAFKFSLVMFVFSLLITGSYAGLLIFSFLTVDFQPYMKTGLLGVVLFGFSSLIVWFEGIDKELNI